MVTEQVLETNIPQRLDRLPFSRWHLVMVIALGITWLLDGLEVTLAGSLASILKLKSTLGLTDVQVGATATGYLAGAVAGALVFGWLTDRYGRKKLFFITLAIYLCATGATALSWNFESFLILRVLTGAGIGGEYAAINSAIDELIPAEVRGRVDLMINATFWIGAALGSAGTLILLDSGLVSPSLGWRLAFGIGALLGLIILFLRRSVPESPRWLMLRGREAEADQIVSEIEAAVEAREGVVREPEGCVRITVRDHTPLRDVWNTMVRDQPRRSLLGLTLMIGQAFFYNAVFFTYGLALSTFFHVRNERVPLYLLPLALGNFAGPLILGKYFDSIGRRKMITATYVTSGLLLIGSAVMFRGASMGPVGQDVWFVAIFFVASSAASSAYLTVSEVFPLEIRASAISIFLRRGHPGRRGRRSHPVCRPDLLRIPHPTLLGLRLGCRSHDAWRCCRAIPGRGRRAQISGVDQLPAANPTMNKGGKATLDTLCCQEWIYASLELTRSGRCCWP
jgi:MFS family permease